MNLAARLADAEQEVTHLRERERLELHFVGPGEQQPRLVGLFGVGRQRGDVGLGNVLERADVPDRALPVAHGHHAVHHHQVERLRGSVEPTDKKREAREKNVGVRAM